MLLDFDLASRLNACLPPWLGVRVELGSPPPVPPDAERLNAYLSVTEDAAWVSPMDGTRLLVTPDRILLDSSSRVDGGTDPAALSDLEYLVYSWGVRLVRTLRKQFSLHAAGFLYEGEAVAIVGMGHAGKSTTLLGLRDRGFTPIVDDLLAVDLPTTGNGAAVCSGWTRPVHVRSPSVAQVPEWGEGPSISAAMRPDRPVALAAVSQDHTLIPLRLLVHLRRSGADHVGSTPMSGPDKLAMISDTVDRWGQSTFGGRAGSFFRWAAGVSGAAPGIRIDRPVDRWCLDDVMDEVLAAAAAVPPARSAGSAGDNGIVDLRTRIGEHR